MLKWSIIFFIIAAISGLLGFTGVSSVAGGIAKVLFYIFLTLFIASLVIAGLITAHFI